MPGQMSPIATGAKVADPQTGMDMDSSPSDAASVGGRSSTDDSASNLEEVVVDSLASAELALLEKSLKNGDPSD